MFEDLKGIAPADLEDQIKELREALRDTRQWMRDKQSECDTLKKLYNESFTDAQRFAQKLADIEKRIMDKNLHDDFKDIIDS